MTNYAKTMCANFAKFYNKDLQQVVFLDDAEYIVFSSEDSREALYKELNINLFYDKFDDLIFQRTETPGAWFSINLLTYYKNREIEKLVNIGTELTEKSINYKALLYKHAYCFDCYANAITPWDNKEICYIKFKNLDSKCIFFKNANYITVVESNERDFAFMKLTDTTWKSFNQEIKELSNEYEKKNMLAEEIHQKLRKTEEVLSEICDYKDN